MYDRGRYGEAADVGLELLAARPDRPYLYYNVACCESLSGRTAGAVEHLHRAIEMWEGCRELAKNDSDFDPMRADPSFAALVAGG